MIVLYGGRLVLERRNLIEKWQVTIKVPLAGKRNIDLDTYDVREAFIRAQYHYMALKKNASYEEIEEEEKNELKCWTCNNWLPRGNNCVFEFPEARQTCGRYASKCEMYTDGTTDFAATDARRGSLD